jgi:hypothetical protein
MNVEQETLTKIQSIAAIASSVAIPIVIALVGWWVQSSISTEGIKKDYVQMAIGILKDTEKQKDEEMRKWAVSVLDKNSPVPFSEELRNKLEKGSVYVRLPFPEPPKTLMEPPLEFKERDKTKLFTEKELHLWITENWGRYERNRIKLVFLQDWISSMKAIDDKHRSEP